MSADYDRVVRPHGADKAAPKRDLTDAEAKIKGQVRGIVKNQSCHLESIAIRHPYMKIKTLIEALLTAHKCSGDKFNAMLADIGSGAR
jgi:hypothetical protein